MPRFPIEIKRQRKRDGKALVLDRRRIVPRHKVGKGYLRELDIGHNDRGGDINHGVLGRGDGQVEAKAHATLLVSRRPE